MSRIRVSGVFSVFALASLLIACGNGGTSSNSGADAAPAKTLYECHLVGGGSATYLQLDPKNQAVEEGREKDKLTVITAPAIYNSDGVVTWSRDNTNLSFDKNTGELDWAVGQGMPSKDICKPI